MKSWSQLFIFLICHQIINCIRFHIYVIGSEECERSIAQSAVNTSKKYWESYLTEVLGPMYVPLRSHTLQVSTALISAQV